MIASNQHKKDVIELQKMQLCISQNRRLYLQNPHLGSSMEKKLLCASNPTTYIIP